jgi:hypothetical protein
MCAIIGSFDLDKLKELVELNSYRGNHSFSFGEYDLETKEFRQLRKSFGGFNLGGIPIRNNCYYIAHIQAPTTQAISHNNIHPSEWEDSLLWHNGILKEKFIDYLQSELNSNDEWDTHLLHKYIKYSGAYEALDGLDGTFSCLYNYKDIFRLFRNEISPMFMDDDLNLSSTKFPNSYPTPPNQVLEIDFENKKLIKLYEFTTFENPYYF